MIATTISSPQATPVARLAAEELARYLERMTGEREPIANAAPAPAIRLEVDANDPALAATDSFRIAEDNDVITIRSASPRGLLMAAYHYLRLLGCRFYFPGADNEFVPKRNDAILRGVDVTESPAFDKRGVVIYARNTAFADWFDFAPKVKLNTIAVHSFDDVVQAEPLAAARGLRLDVETHAFGGDLCPTNHDNLRRETEKMAELVRRLPDCVHDLFLWPKDASLKPCGCPEHQHLSASDEVLMLVNKLLAAARTVRPAERLCYLAYVNTLPAPKQAKPDDGVFLEWAPMNRCMSHALTDPDCTINARDHIPHLLDNLKLFPADQAQVLGYWLDSSLFNRGQYKANAGRLPLFPDIIRSDFKYYASLGFNEITTFAVGLDKEYFARFTSPSVTAYADLLWDTDADVEGETKLFCENFFGTADAQVGLVLDTAMDERHNPDAVRVDAEIEEAIPAVAALARDASDDFHRTRLLRLEAELRHRLAV